MAKAKSSKDGKSADGRAKKKAEHGKQNAGGTGRSILWLGLPMLVVGLGIMGAMNYDFLVDYSQKWNLTIKYDFIESLVRVLTPVDPRKVDIRTSDTKTPNTDKVNKKEETSKADANSKGKYNIQDKIKQDDNGSKKDWQENLAKNGASFRVLTDEQIKYRKGGKFRLVVVGHVFDVSGAAKMYGEGSGYHGFIGRDGSRAFVTGKFDDEGLVPDLDGLELDDLKGISNWINFYLNHETYKFIGVHAGWFFDATGKPTENLIKFQKGLVEADKKIEADNEMEQLYPSCNSEWTAQSGSRVWCSQMSGGVSRDWVGYPRVFNQEGKSARCACVEDKNSKDKRLEAYKDCASDSNECRIKS